MDIFIARQPIFNTKQEVFAYELLYRSGTRNVYAGIDGDRASSEVIGSSFLLFGLENLTMGKKAFINFTRKLLEDEVATLLPQELIVVEVLENVEPDKQMLSACIKLKELGYLLALNDFTYDPRFDPFIDLVDIIKVDFLQTTPAKREALVRRAKNKKIKFLAEKVETLEDFHHALQAGYSYFQGYFFSKPNIVSGKDITSFKLTYLQLLQEINKTDLDFDQAERIIKSDVALSYKLLRFINSAAFSFPREISSIKQALVLLGQKEILKWVSLVALRSIGEDKPDELVSIAISRGRFCELMAPQIGMKSRSPDFFLMGMFSLIDAFLDQPLAHILTQLPIATDIKEALLGIIESRLRDVYEMAVSYEKGNWVKALRLAKKLHLEEQRIINIYLESLNFAQRIFSEPQPARKRIETVENRIY